MKEKYIYCIYWKKSAYKRSHVFQSHVVQELTFRMEKKLQQIIDASEIYVTFDGDLFG